MASIEAFRTQSGYYGYEAIAPFANILKTAASSGRAVIFVLGANHAQLDADDLENTLQVKPRGTIVNASLGDSTPPVFRRNLLQWFLLTGMIILVVKASVAPFFAEPLVVPPA